MGEGKKKGGKSSTKQAVRSGWKGDPNNINRAGKGGFQEHPENRSNGRWKKETSFSYWLNFFKTLPLQEFSQYKRKNPEMCMAALAAWARVSKAIEKLDEFREVANRTEGMPTQRTEITGADGQPIRIESVDVNKLSKDEQEKFLSIYNKIVNTQENGNDS